MCDSCGFKGEAPDVDCYTLPNGECVAEQCRLHGPVETIVVDPDTGGMKGQKDVRLHALPWESLQELGRVFAFGEEKYDDYNFRKGYKWSLSYDALLRHLGEFWNGTDRDGESRLHHVAHAMWHCAVLLLFSLKGLGKDDRPSN